MSCRPSTLGSLVMDCTSPLEFNWAAMESPTFGSAFMLESRVTFMELSRPLDSRIRYVSSMASTSPVMFWQGEFPVHLELEANSVPDAGFGMSFSPWGSDLARRGKHNIVAVTMLIVNLVFIPSPSGKWFCVILVWNTGYASGGWEAGLNCSSLKNSPLPSLQQEGSTPRDQ